MSGLPHIQRFVAIGDSQTEGLHDYRSDGSLRGWADRVAEAIAVHQPELRYANLAVRGKRTAEIRRTQLAPALALEPDLATVVSGVNDVVRPRVDVDAVAADLEAMWEALAAQGCRVMTCTFPLPRVGLTRRVAPRLQALNTRIRVGAERQGVEVVELEDFVVAADLRLWSPDRIHLNTEGHARLAAAFVASLGDDADASWRAPLPAAPEHGWPRRAAGEAAWLARFLLPKLGRMARGKSSGDGREAKRPEPLPIRPERG